MKTINSLSGGKSSSYLAANYKVDYNVFALVRTEDVNCKFPDELIRKQVEDRIQKPFVGTLEDDTIIYTMLDLEQFIGSKIDWVSGITFDEVVRSKGGWLPNKLHRYCTSHMKIEPIFYWWAENIGEVIIENIGFRSGEESRAKRMKKKLIGGKLVFKATFEKHKNGKNKWEDVSWAIPKFPLIEDNIFKDFVNAYWKDKPVRFASKNNCVGCFHQNPILLNYRFNNDKESNKKKLAWFENQELGRKKGTWRSDASYSKIRRKQFTMDLFDDMFDDCDSGGCGL